MQTNNTEYIEEIEQLSSKVKESRVPTPLQEVAERNIDRLRRMARIGSYSNDYEVISKYISWITQLPWGVLSEDNLDIQNAKNIMDSTHFGMDTVKELILDYLAVMSLKKGQLDSSAAVAAGASQEAFAGKLRGSSANAPVMLFVGLQGVGKTSIAHSIAQAMGREFVRVPLGAIGSAAAIRGQLKNVPNAEPGYIMKGLIKAKTMNPVMLLDEIDKSSGNQGLLSDIMATLLEILDPEQNHHFVDQYIDYPVDLSKVFFICTANNLGSLSAALMDRLEIIRFVSYSDEEKEVIAKKYAFPKIVQNAGLQKGDVVLDEDVWPVLIRPVGFDAGLRQLERNLTTVVRKAARRILDGASRPVVITTENVREFVLPDQGPLS